MTKATADRMTLFVAAFGALLTIASYGVAGGSAAYSTVTGAALALANFLVLRAIVVRVTSGEMQTRGPFLALIFLKMGALMGLVFFVIFKHWVEPIAFTVGLSSLVVGLITASAFATPSNSASES